MSILMFAKSRGLTNGCIQMLGLLRLTSVSFFTSRIPCFCHVEGKPWLQKYVEENSGEVSRSFPLKLWPSYRRLETLGC